MICKPKELNEIIDLVAGEGVTKEGKNERMIHDMLMKVSKSEEKDVGGEIKVLALDEEGIIFVNLMYKFVDGSKVYEEGMLSIGDVGAFKAYLNRFDLGADIEVKKDRNNIDITALGADVKRAMFPSVDVGYIESSKGVHNILQKYSKVDGFPTNVAKDIVLETKVSVNSAEKIKELIDDSRVVPLPRSYNFSFRDGVVVGTVGSDHGGKIVSHLPAVIEAGGDVTVSFADGLDHIFSAIKGVVTLFVSTNKPMWIEKEDRKYFVQYFLAPKTS